MHGTKLPYVNISTKMESIIRVLMSSDDIFYSVLN